MAVTERVAPVAAKLASKLGCDVALATAALKVCHGHVPTAAQVIENGRANPMDPYEYVDSLAPGPSHGDAIFRHPWVQCLSEVARGRVRQALDQQPGPPEDKWLICIRTFGRPGVRCQQSEVHRLLHGIFKKKTADIWEEKFQAAELGLPALRRMAQKPFESFLSALKDAGIGGLNRTNAKILADKVCEPLEKVEKKLVRSEKGLLDLTLAALELALGPRAYKHCLIFVSHTDSAWISGRYAAALSGTPWADRIVVGIRGAHLQVRFMEEAAPKGSHIVVMDDNIERLMVEIADNSLAEQQKAAGIVDYYVQPLKAGNCLNPLSGTGLTAVQEPEVLRFLRGVCPELEKKERHGLKVEEILQKVQVTSIQKFKSLSPEKADASLQALGLAKKKRKACVEALKGKHSKLPPPRLLARLTNKEWKQSREPELSQLIRRAGREMQNQGMHLWGANPTRNHFYLKSRGDSMRESAVKTGIFKDYSTRLGLVYGAWFGLRVTHNPQFYTRQGQIKDDVERTLRYWHADKGQLRFFRYSADKLGFKPGQFSSNKGGISANSSQEEHSAEAKAALQSLIQEFGAYVRFPKDNEQSSCGLVWSVGSKRKANQAVDLSESKKQKLDK